MHSVLGLWEYHIGGSWQETGMGEWRMEKWF